MDGDLISRKELRDLWLYNGLNEHIYCTNDVLDSIDEQPAVDAEPVKRARWKPSPVPYVLPRCSACGEMGYMNWVACPHCGARMDGRQENNE